MFSKLRALAGCGLLCLALSACGGGDGGVNSTPFVPPPPPPPPPPTCPPTCEVTIFQNPQVGEFASVGASVKGSDSTNLDAPLGAISTADDDQPHISFTSSGMYLIELPGEEADELIPFGQGTANTVLTDTDHDVFLDLSGSKDHGYKYSEVARYQSADQIGAFAFGTLTPEGAVPLTGAATYSGVVKGTSDVIASDSFDGPNRAFVEGSVNLNFDFGSGSLAGAMTISLFDAAGGPLQLGTFNFKDTVFGVGNTSYAGKFDTAAVGDNFFLGQFTGPHAEETIGAWALPFILDVGNQTITADHKAHQAFGAWIAKGP